MAKSSSSNLKPSPSKDRTRVFISYSRLDAELVDRIAAALDARQTFQLFRDTQDILPSEDWRSRLEGLIVQADTIVFCLSPASAASDVCCWEVATAEKLNKRIVPVVLRDVVGRVPGGLGNLNYIFFNFPGAFDASVAKLVQALDTDIFWIREHTRIGELSRRWAMGGERPEHLLRGIDVGAAETWASYWPSNAPELTETTKKFIAESRKDVTERERRDRHARDVMAGLCLLLLAIAAGWVYQKPIREKWFLATMVHQYVLGAKAESAAAPGMLPFRECVRCPEMVVLPAGEFLMGSPESEKSRNKDEGPQRGIVIARPFALSRFEVKREEWQLCVDYGGCPTGSSGQGPAEGISWLHARHYAKWLSRITGKDYRLPTEAEWEYAARAGTTTAYFWGEETGSGHANCYGCGSQWDGKQAAPVGSFEPNAFGLYDMHGNLWEWTEDCYEADYTSTPADGSARESESCEFRVLRSGSFDYDAGSARSANRDRNRPVVRNNRGGMRLARSMVPK